MWRCSLPRVDGASGDGQDSVDERDLGVAITVGGRLTSGGAGSRSVLAKCSPAALGVVVCCAWAGLLPRQARSLCLAHAAGSPSA